MRRHLFPAPAILALAATLGVAACSPADHQAAPPRAEAAPAETLRVAVRPVADMKPVAGEVTTRDEGLAVARIGGVLTELHVREGQEVRAGQVLGVIRDARLGLETASYAALARAAEAEAARAEADLARTRDLFEKGVYARARLDQVEAAAAAARAQAEAVRAQGAASAEVAAQGVVRAPAAGRVLRADVTAGSAVMPGQVIAVVTAGPPVVRVRLPDGQAAALRPGLVVELTPDGTGGAMLRAPVLQVYPAVEQGQVVADIDAAGLDTRLVGRRIAVRLPVGERPGIVVPARYVATRFGIDYVRLVRDGAVVDSPVQTAPGPGADEVEVLSGLAAGDRIAPWAGSAR